MQKSVWPAVKHGGCTENEAKQTNTLFLKRNYQTITNNTSYGGPEDLKLAIPVPEKRKGHAIQLMKSTVKSSR